MIELPLPVGSLKDNISPKFTYCGDEDEPSLFILSSESL
jgi:hypothetical protein